MGEEGISMYAILLKVLAPINLEKDQLGNDIQLNAGDSIYLTQGEGGYIGERLEKLTSLHMIEKHEVYQITADQGEAIRHSRAVRILTIGELYEACGKP
jgi:hypothetical protein